MSENETFSGGWSIPKMVEKLWSDLYHGNGRPGLTTRIKEVEDDIASIEDLKCDAAEFKQLEDRVKTLETYNKERDNRLYARINLLIAAALTLASAIFLQLILKK